MPKKLQKIAALSLALLIGNVAMAASVADPEIEYLLTTVGNSGCEFIRNGDVHAGPDAEAHLRMKYKRGQRWVSSAEDFIERLASKSSWSGKPYQVQCPGAAPMPSEIWFTDKLGALRSE